MELSSLSPNFDYYDFYNDQLDIRNNFSPPYQMISSSSSLTSSELSSILKNDRESIFIHNNNNNNNINHLQYETTPTILTTVATSTTLAINNFIINNEISPTINYNNNNKLRNAQVDPNLAFWAVVDGVLLVFILGGNFLTIIAVRFSRRLRSITSNLFVLSLAISDILVGFTLPYHLAFYMGSGLGKTKEYCLLRFFLIILACCNSIWNLIAIAVDRYIAIFFPLHYSRYMTKKVAIILLGFGWILGIAFATIPLIWNNWDTATQCEFDEILKPWYMAGVITPGFSMVWLCMLTVYLRIWREAAKHAKQLRSSFTGLHETPSDSKSVQVVLFILGCFSFCWLPYFIIACVQIFKYVDKSTPMLYKAAFSLAMANSGMNPIIYAWKNTGFRRAFARLLRCQSPDYNDVSQHSIRSLNKRRKSSGSQPHPQQQQQQQKIGNIITSEFSSSKSKIKLNDEANIVTPPLSSISITSSNAIPNDGINLHQKIYNKNNFSDSNTITNETSTITPNNKTSGNENDKFYYANKINSRNSAVNNYSINNNKVRKSSLKRTESSDDDRMSTPHGVFPRKTSFGTVTTTIINTSTDDDDGDYEYNYHRMGNEKTTDTGISNIGNNVAGNGFGHHNILMSTIVSLDDISLVATTATTKSSSSYSFDTCAETNDIQERELEQKDQQFSDKSLKLEKPQIKQQHQILTKCIASIKDVNELKIAKNSFSKNCKAIMGNSLAASSSSCREGFIIEKIECDGNGNNTTKCVCVLNPKELKRKLKNLNDWSSNSTTNTISDSISTDSDNTIPNSFNNLSSNVVTISELKTTKKCKSPKILKTTENPIEKCTSNIEKDLQQTTSIISSNKVIAPNNVEIGGNSSCGNNCKTNVQKFNKKILCNGNHVINCKNNEKKCCKNNIIV
ncbi:uncharacterized protein LOC129605636 [Condylostylus longicornis]|uniref:uncharacterized protein LOC129605636 n=1 Tax=Condylostylus longicornis TaxID=2530218 RepID=UPI00244E1002|nr:uncharacterized protein LOC129605636 [Condylostylus longicornis]